MCELNIIQVPIVLYLIGTCCLTRTISTTLFNTNSRENSFFLSFNRGRKSARVTFRANRFLQARVTVFKYRVAHRIPRGMYDRYICWRVIVSDDHFGPYPTFWSRRVTIPHSRSLLTTSLSPSFIFRLPSSHRPSLSLSLSFPPHVVLAFSRSLPPSRALYLHPSLSVSLHSFERHPTFP